MYRVIGYLVLAISMVIAGACALPAHGADKSKSGKIKAAQQPKYEPPSYVPPAEELPPYNVHNWYAGVTGGYAWAPNGFDDTWHGGVYGGYLWRPNAVLGLGVEADYVLRDLGDLALDDGIASLRGRVGVFVAPGTFLYGTAGVAQATAAFVPDGFRKGLVVGGGIERDVTKTVAIRAEVLHYRHADEYLDWGEQGSTAARVGLAFKF